MMNQNEECIKEALELKIPEQFPHDAGTLNERVTLHHEWRPLFAWYNKYFSPLSMACRPCFQKVKDKLKEIQAIPKIC